MISSDQSVHTQYASTKRKPTVPVLDILNQLDEVTITEGIVALLIGTAIIAFAVWASRILWKWPGKYPRRWLRFFLWPRVVHFLDLIRKLNRPVIISHSIHVELLNTEQNHKDELRKKEQQLQDMITTWKKTDESLDMMVANRDKLAEENNRLIHENTTLKAIAANNHIDTIGKTGEICRVHGWYTALHTTNTRTDHFRKGDRFPPVMYENNRASSGLWVLETSA